jgi:DNA-binding transcriptional LysR family regulator
LRKDLEAGAVIPILDEYVTEGAPVSVYYPVNRHLPAKVKAFIDFLIEITQET